jgi:iron complex outermembrane receptor protein
VLLESNLASDLSFGREKAKGGEVGFKATFLAHRLSLISSLYYYEHTDLQLYEFDSTTTSFFITNAGSAVTRGAEIQGAYQASPQLSFCGIVDFNDGYFSSYPNAACYAAQTVAEGCNIPTAFGTDLQNLTGKALPNAPRWVFATGFAWNHPVSKGLDLGLDADVKYSSKYAFAGRFPARCAGRFRQSECSPACLRR